jgi:hypothetical protein
VLAVQDHLPCYFGEVEGFPPLDPALAAGQGEQRVDEPFLLLAQVQHLLAG